MRKFITFIIFVVLLGLVTSYLVPLRFSSRYPKDPGPEFDRRVRTNFTEDIDKKTPEIVIIGDSTLKESTDFNQLSQALGKTTYGIANPGSSTAFWYLALKNNIAPAEHKPEYLVIFFRDTMLTTPEFRVEGKEYFEIIDEYAAADEPLLLELSYLGQMNALEKIMSRYLPIFADRDQIHASIEYRIKHSLPVLFGCGEVCVSRALSTVYWVDLDEEAAFQIQNEQEIYLRRADKLLFNRQLSRSYLPEFERITRENNIQLILVEMKTLKKPPAILIGLLHKRYMNDLHTYAEEHGIPIISFIDDPRLPDEYFPDGFHLGREYIPYFTNLLAEALEPILED